MPPPIPVSWGVCRTTQVSNSSSCKLILSSLWHETVTSRSFFVVVCFAWKKGIAGLKKKIKKKRKGKKVRQTHRYEIVTVPPEHLSILNEDGTSHIPYYILGPYTEGASLNITCDATGGKYSCFTYSSLPASLLILLFRSIDVEYFEYLCVLVQTRVRGCLLQFYLL